MRDSHSELSVIRIANLSPEKNEQVYTWQSLQPFADGGRNGWAWERIGDEKVGDETVGGRNDRIPVEPFLCMLFSHFYLYIESFLFSINHDFTYRYVL